MADEIKDGGPAFPGFEYEHGSGCSKTVYTPEGQPITQIYTTGMSLRDWFAGMVLQGIAANSDQKLEIAHAVVLAYSTADAMLAKRVMK
jgi:hypothetical protein